MDSTYATIKRLEKISDDKYIFGFSMPVKDSIYTIYHEAKISSQSIHQLIGISRVPVRDFMIGQKMDISVLNETSCLVHFKFNGFFIEKDSYLEALHSVFSLQYTVQRSKDIYILGLANTDRNFEFVITKETFDSLAIALGIPSARTFQNISLPDAKLVYFGDDKSNSGVILAYSISIPLKDTKLKVYFTKTKTE